MRRYSLSELQALPTLHQAQADDCKVDTGTERVWLSRMSVEDGEPFNNAVTVERFNGTRWIALERYEAK